MSGFVLPALLAASRAHVRQRPCTGPSWTSRNHKECRSGTEAPRPSKDSGCRLLRSQIGPSAAEQLHNAEANFTINIPRASNQHGLVANAMSAAYAQEQEK